MAAVGRECGGGRCDGAHTIVVSLIEYGGGRRTAERRADAVPEPTAMAKERGGTYGEAARCGAAHAHRIWRHARRNAVGTDSASSWPQRATRHPHLYSDSHHRCMRAVTTASPSRAAHGGHSVSSWPQSHPRPRPMTRRVRRISTDT